jgi:hypothetical protein
MPGGLDRNEQLPGVLRIGVPGADQVEDLALAPGQSRVAMRGPLGIERMPSRRIFCRVSWAVADAPTSVKIRSASCNEDSSAEPSKDSPAS